jgi:hypothetical protein
MLRIVPFVLVVQPQISTAFLPHDDGEDKQQAKK